MFILHNLPPLCGQTLSSTYPAGAGLAAGTALALNAAGGGAIVVVHGHGLAQM